jgi:hypothetical protein
MNEKVSWLMPHLKAILEKNKPVLSNWRKQEPTQSGRIKNFENWLIVELVHRLRESGFVSRIRTNGHYADEKVKTRNVKGLAGTKSKATHLSADIAAICVEDGRILNAEIKTGLSPKEIMDDIRIVQYYCSNKDLKIADKSEFGWVVILPEEDKENVSAKKTYTKIIEKIKSSHPTFEILNTEVTNWLFLCVVIPNN